MFDNTLVVGSSIRKAGKSSKTAKRPAIWIGVRRGKLVGHQPCSITLWWLVRVRPAPPRSRPQPEKSCFEKRTTAPDIAGRDSSHAGAAGLPARSSLSIEGFAAAIVAKPKVCDGRG